MTVSIILYVLWFLTVLFFGWLFIRYTIVQQQKLKVKKNELDNYKLVISAIQKFTNMATDKRVSLEYKTNNEVLGILSRCGFGVRYIFDLEKGSDHAEIYKLKE